MDEFRKQLSDDTLNAQSIFELYSKRKDGLALLRKYVDIYQKENEEIMIEVSPFGKTSRNPLEHINDIKKTMQKEKMLVDSVSSILEKNQSADIRNKYKIICLCEAKETINICQEGLKAMKQSKNINAFKENIDPITKMYFRLLGCDPKFANEFMNKIRKTICKYQISEVADTFNSTQIEMMCRIIIENKFNSIINSKVDYIDKLNSLRNELHISVPTNENAETLYTSLFSQLLQDSLNNGTLPFNNSADAVIEFAKLKKEIPTLDLSYHSDKILRHSSQISKGGIDNVLLLVELENEIKESDFGNFAKSIIKNIAFTPENVLALSGSKLIPFIAQNESLKISQMFNSCVTGNCPPDVIREAISRLKSDYGQIFSDAFTAAVGDEIVVSTAENLAQSKVVAIAAAYTVLQGSEAVYRVRVLETGNFDGGFLQDARLLERYERATSKLRAAKP